MPLNTTVNDTIVTTLCVHASLDSSKFFHFITEKTLLFSRWTCWVSGTFDPPSLLCVLLAKVNIWEGGWAPTTLFIFRKGGYPLYIYRQCNYFENQCCGNFFKEVASPILINAHLRSHKFCKSFSFILSLYSLIFQWPITYWQVLGFRLWPLSLSLWSKQSRYNFSTIYLDRCHLFLRYSKL